MHITLAKWPAETKIRARLAFAVALLLVSGSLISDHA